MQELRDTRLRIALPSRSLVTRLAQEIRYPIMIEDGGTAMYEEVVRNLYIDAIYADTIKRVLVRYSP
ncbi:hypothetical protein GOBAR_DD23200 [Gossypium barbadense]|nr:hypothetical protein GOBAR_DD23200 [Gossypium barbadense]